MRFVADEGADSQIVNSLRIHGHDVIYIAESSRGSLDDVILNLANLDDRILITRDKKFQKKFIDEKDVEIDGEKESRKKRSEGIYFTR